MSTKAEEKPAGSAEKEATETGQAESGPDPSQAPTLAALEKHSIRVMKDSAQPHEANDGPKLDGANEEPQIAEEASKA